MISLQLATLRTLERAANTAIARVIELDPKDTGKGAMFRLFYLSSPSDGMAGLSELWSGWIGGRANSAKRAKYSIFSFEKALRTALNHQRHGHVSSFESSSPAFHQYQGAALLRAEVPDIDPTRASLLIASVSGLAALNDQRTALLTIQLMPWDARNSITHALSITEDRDYLHLLRGL